MDRIVDALYLAVKRRPSPMPTIDRATRDLLFSDARTHNAWLDRPVPDELLHELYDLAKMGPTGGNSQPMRLVFVRSTAAKERLKPALAPGNVDKTMKAPVTAIVAHDLKFYEKLARLMPVLPGIGDHVAAMPAPVRERMALQSASLQAAYLILAARGLGLDCGPMGGFDVAAVDRLFFPDGERTANLLINLGYGDGDKLFPRQPRLSFDEACRIE
jgi:3-hydroxypropanoate dehydrogenase